MIIYLPVALHRELLPHLFNSLSPHLNCPPGGDGVLTCSTLAIHFISHHFLPPSAWYTNVHTVVPPQRFSDNTFSHSQQGGKIHPPRLPSCVEWDQQRYTLWVHYQVLISRCRKHQIPNTPDPRPPDSLFLFWQPQRKTLRIHCKKQRTSWKIVLTKVIISSWKCTLISISFVILPFIITTNASVLQYSDMKFIMKWCCLADVEMDHHLCRALIEEEELCVCTSGDGTG